MRCVIENKLKTFGERLKRRKRLKEIVKGAIDGKRSTERTN